MFSKLPHNIIEKKLKSNRQMSGFLKIFNLKALLSDLKSFKIYRIAFF